MLQTTFSICSSGVKFSQTFPEKCVALDNVSQANVVDVFVYVFGLAFFNIFAAAKSKLFFL